LISLQFFASSYHCKITNSAHKDAKLVIFCSVVNFLPLHYIPSNKDILLCSNPCNSIQSVILNQTKRTINQQLIQNQKALTASTTPAQQQVVYAPAASPIKPRHTLNRQAYTQPPPPLILRFKEILTLVRPLEELIIILITTTTRPNHPYKQRFALCQPALV
jgi:hypothetical protein